MKACVLTGRERHRFVRGNIQRFRSAERPQLEWRATPVRARGPSPLFFSLQLSSSHPPVFLFQSSWMWKSLTATPPPPLPPPARLPSSSPLQTHPSTHPLPDPGQFSPAMRGHLWEFIPDASCSLRPLFSLSLSLSILYLSLHPVHPHHRLCVSSFTIRCKGTMPDLLCRHFLILLSRLYMFSWHLYPQVAPDLK